MDQVGLTAQGIVVLFLASNVRRSTATREETTMTKFKRIHAGRYEDGTYGIRHGSQGGWQTFTLVDEETHDGGWMQSYRTLRDAKAGISELRAATTTAAACSISNAHMRRG